MLGLWGMGGVGKTTLATTLFNRMLPGFGDAVCFLENVYEEAKEPGGMLRMQLQLLRALTNEDLSATVTSKFMGAYMPSACLCLVLTMRYGFHNVYAAQANLTPHASCILLFLLTCMPACQGKPAWPNS